MVSLGDRVRCKYSGFEGTAISRTEFINGCVQFGVVAKVKNKSDEPKDMQFDEDTLEVVKPKKRPKPRRTGGAMTKAIGMKGF